MMKSMCSLLRIGVAGIVEANSEHRLVPFQRVHFILLRDGCVIQLPAFKYQEDLHLEMMNDFSKEMIVQMFFYSRSMFLFIAG